MKKLTVKEFPGLTYIKSWAGVDPTWGTFKPRFPQLLSAIRDRSVNDASMPLLTDRTTNSNKVIVSIFRLFAKPSLCLCFLCVWLYVSCYGFSPCQLFFLSRHHHALVYAQRDINCMAFLYVRLSVWPMQVLYRNDCKYRQTFSTSSRAIIGVYLSPTAWHGGGLV